MHGVWKYIAKYWSTLDGDPRVSEAICALSLTGLCHVLSGVMGRFKASKLPACTSTRMVRVVMTFVYCFRHSIELHSASVGITLIVRRYVGILVRGTDSSARTQQSNSRGGVSESHESRESSSFTMLVIGLNLCRI